MLTSPVDFFVTKIFGERYSSIIITINGRKTAINKQTDRQTDR